ncbi:MAG: hypothetical protein AAF541_15205 [Pseudomonadota bacterium]
MTDIDQLAFEWRAQEGRFTVDEDQMLRFLIKDGRKFERSVRFRDYTEISVGVLVTIFFAVVPLLDRGQEAAWYERWEWYVLSLGCLFVTLAFLYHRKRMRALGVNAADNIAVTTRMTLAQVEYQIHILRRVAWWYCAPLELPLILVALRDDSFDEIRWPYLGFSVLLFVGAVLGNLAYVKYKLEPRQRRLCSMSCELAA